MRIKDVCKETGLTDKAIRIYINNELISPSYQESYNGRRNYTFSNEDVEQLKKIALLRKYDFSISSIREMLENNNSIAEILDNHLKSTKQTIAQSSMVLTNLHNAKDNNVDNLEELCEILNQNVKPNEPDFIDKMKDLWYKIKRRIPLLILVALIIGVIATILLILIIFALTKLFLAL